MNYQEGQVVELNCLHEVIHVCPAHLTRNNGDYTLVKTMCNLKRHDDLFNYLRGKYVITKITLEGGGRSHNDVVPDYMHVHCQHVELPHLTVTFLPTANPCGKVTTPCVIGTATPNWTWEPNNA